jgi:hypothetical protein
LSAGISGGTKDMVLVGSCESMSIYSVDFKRGQRRHTARNLGGNHDAQQAHKVTWGMRVNYAASIELLLRQGVVE